MQYVKRGATNYLSVSIKDARNYSESVTTYIFVKLTNDFTKQSVYYYPSSVTNYSRYSKIRLIEPADATLTPEGAWKYVIYETLSSGLSNDSTLSSTHIVEQGRLKVTDISVTEVSYTEYTPPSNNTNTTNTNTVYLNI